MSARGDITKLPKWAQSHITRLERDLESARARLAAGPENSNTFADPYGDAPRPLGEDTTIEFHVDGVKIRVRVEKDCLDVNGGDSLAISPRASNSIEIRPRRF